MPTKNIKKKTSPKASPKTKRDKSAQASAEDLTARSFRVAGLKRQKFMRTKKVAKVFTKTTKKMVDQILLKVSPNIESQIQQMGQNLNKSPLGMDHLKALGFRVLEKARSISAGLRSERAKKRVSKMIHKKRNRP